MKLVALTDLGQAPQSHTLLGQVRLLPCGGNSLRYTTCPNSLSRIGFGGHCSAHHLCVDLIWAVTHVVRSARRLYRTVQYEVGRLYYLVL